MFMNATCQLKTLGYRSLRIAALKQQLHRFLATEASTHTKPFRVSGLCVAPLTPFQDNGDVNLDIIPSYADHLEEFKANSLFITGTISEGNSLTVSERKAVMKAWTEAARNRFQTVLHIGTGNLRDSQELAEYAESIGADAISCVTPTYHKPKTVEDYVEYMKNVAAAAPNLPFYLYDIDFVTGLYLDLAKFFDLGKDSIPTLAGIKHTSPSLSSMNQIHMIDSGRFNVMLGGDETYLAALAIGLSTSVIPSYSCPTLHRIKDAFQKKDLESARLDQNRMLQVAKIRNRYPMVAVSKAITKTLGVDVGPPRLPLKPCSEREMHKLHAELSAIGFYEWVKS